ncbi:MAG: hypothetical protein AB2L14_08640 [Candidatus Xenobiia bacterium LiM19]
MTTGINGSINFGNTLSGSKQPYIRPMKDDDLLMAGIRVGINTADTYAALDNLLPATFQRTSFMDSLTNPQPVSYAGYGFLMGVVQAGFGAIKCMMNVNKEYVIPMKVSGIGDIITGAGLAGQTFFGAAALPVTVAGIAITTAAKMYEVLTVNRRF